MKMNTKGVSPVIATILLIALTVASVGIVAVVLSGMGTPVIPPSTIVTFYQYGYYNNDNKGLIRYRVNTTGGDTVSGTDIKITFVAKICSRATVPEFTRNDSTMEVKGTLTNFGAGTGTGAATATVTWDTPPTNYDMPSSYNTLQTISFSPALESGKTSELMLEYGTGAITDNYLDITSISIVDIPSSSVIYSQTSVPAPQALG